MDELPPSALGLVRRLAHAAATPDRPRVETALTEILSAVGLPTRPFRWHDDVGDAFVYLARRVLDSLGRSKRSQARGAPDLVQNLFDAAELQFDSGWANAWPLLVADCQIAAGKYGEIESMQAVHRLLRPFVESQAVVAIETDCLRGAAAIASETFAAQSPGHEEIADVARDRIDRHRNNFAQLIEDFLPTLSVGDAAECRAAHTIAHQAVAAWEGGGRVFWIRPDEVVVAAANG